MSLSGPKTTAFILATLLVATCFAFSFCQTSASETAPPDEVLLIQSDISSDSAVTDLVTSFEKVSAGKNYFESCGMPVSVFCPASFEKGDFKYELVEKMKVMIGADSFVNRVSDIMDRMPKDPADRPTALAVTDGKFAPIECSVPAVDCDFVRNVLEFIEEYDIESTSGYASDVRDLLEKQIAYQSMTSNLISDGDMACCCDGLGTNRRNGDGTCTQSDAYDVPAADDAADGFDDGSEETDETDFPAVQFEMQIFDGYVSVQNIDAECCTMTMTAETNECLGL